MQRFIPARGKDLFQTAYVKCSQELRYFNVGNCSKDKNIKPEQIPQNNNKTNNSETLTEKQQGQAELEASQKLPARLLHTEPVSHMLLLLALPFKTEV